MNRIYQGRVSKVEVIEGGEPKTVENWGEALWEHHELFQDAVNYYTLGLAAMAKGLRGESAREKAALGWREQVRNSWVRATRKAVSFAGPHARLAGWLGVDVGETNAVKAFEACAAELLKGCSASEGALASALLQLLDEAAGADLNQFCAGRLPWLCTPHGQLDAAPKNVVQQQEAKMLAVIREIHQAKEGELEEAAARMDLGYFVTQMPKERLTGAEARAEAERQFKAACKKARELEAVGGDFAKRLEKLGQELALPSLGRKPKGAYPLAVVFKLLPERTTWEVFKKATASLQRKAEKVQAAPLAETVDYVAQARTKSDCPVFDYFTNRVLVRDEGRRERAVWFEFDLAAFMEAIKSPHRYFEDTLAREKAAAEIRRKLQVIDPETGWTNGEAAQPFAGNGKAGDLEEEEAPTFTFAGDARVKLLRKLVMETLRYAGDSEDPEYTIQERTLRGWGKIREGWRREAAQGRTDKEALWAVVKAEQGERRDDFGSAVLFEKLTDGEFQKIWKEDGTDPRHAEDPLAAWGRYKELIFELEDKTRPIRFTPAHAEHSPRFFILPKVGRMGSEHEAGKLAFSAGMILRGAQGLRPARVRVEYSAPRLRRDGLRREGEEDLEAAVWLQPMMKALGLKEPDTQDFSKCRITLQPDNAGNIQLTFPVEVESGELMKAVRNGKPLQRWERQFNMHPEGDQFYETTLRWPHEKQPAKAPMPWHEGGEPFSCVAVDLGQRDAGACALIAVSSNPERDFGKRPSRFVGQTGEGSAALMWRAALAATRMLRLSGEDRLEWRAPSRREREAGEQDYGWREELYGEKGRLATEEENAECRALFAAFGVKESDLLPDKWEKLLSFPEQNDKLLIAARRAQSRASRLHRWCWFLGDEKKRKAALKEIREFLNAPAENKDPWLSESLKDYAAKDNDPRLEEELRRLLAGRLAELPGLLTRVASRVVPLRGRVWNWERLGGGEGRTTNYRLVQGEAREPEEKIRIRGQRGLSLERIEQIADLRRRLQSLNQLMRREIGNEPPARRDDAVPDPCPELLEKQDKLKRQRVNQTAHLILAEALGVRLAEPPQDKKTLRKQMDQHGVYERAREAADFIVIEDLSRYRASQGRAPQENSRLMKWCHREVRDKLRQLCEPFGIPVLETPAAWSSRFCSRSGVAGFRAMEVHPEVRNEYPWGWHLKRLALYRKDPKQFPLSAEALAEAEEVKHLFDELVGANAGVGGERPQWRTLLAPRTGGPIFVPVCERVEPPEQAGLQPAVVQADINAAINLGLRAVADPRLWSIYPRLRTQRAKKDGGLTAREKRKFPGAKPPELELDGVRLDGDGTAHNPNFFADYAGCVDRKRWGEAKLADGDGPGLVSGKALWITVKARQWERVRQINERRLAGWRLKAQEPL